MKMNRSIGLIGLTFIALSGMLGAGWLFAPLLVSQIAGPAGLVSWLIGGAAMLMFALCYAEVGAMLPVAGGLARIPWFSHGNVISSVVGWTAWIGYTMAAPMEVLTMLKYAGPLIPFIEAAGGGPSEFISLSPAGYAIAIALLAVMVVINAYGVRFFATINTGLTWFKVSAPAIIITALMLADFKLENFTTQGFMPSGMEGIFAAVTSGGVILAFVGFRHAIDMAGEVKNPHRTIPLALIGSIVLCLLIYIGAQSAFIGGVPTPDLSKGWAGVNFPHHAGPFAAIAVVIGVPWLTAIIFGTAVLSPFGGGLVATGSNARLTMVMARIGFFPELTSRLSNRGVPLNGLLLNLAAGVLLLLFANFEIQVTLGSVAVILSFTTGPLALYSLRKQLPDRKRHFRMAGARGISYAAFSVAGVLLYWSGWNTIRLLGVALLVGLVLFVIKRRIADPETRPPVDLQQAGWLVPYLAAIGLTSYLGQFGGGLKIIPQFWGAPIIALYSIYFFYLAVKQRLPAERAAANVREAEAGTDEEFE